METRLPSRAVDANMIVTKGEQQNKAKKEGKHLRRLTCRSREGENNIAPMRIDINTVTIDEVTGKGCTDTIEQI